MSAARTNLSTKAVIYDMDNPFACGEFRYVAKGMYTDGPRCNQPCVCKWFKTGAVYEETFYAKDLKAVDKALEIIEAFNAAGLIQEPIKLNTPTVWVMSGPSRAGQKVLLEPFINNYTKFNSNSGYVNSSSGWSEVMQALSHFSYHKTGGQMVLCDLQGGILSRGRGAVLTDSVILSRSQSYGVTDLGPDGISTFFSRHVCNRHCQAHWQQPRQSVSYYSCRAGTTMELYGEHHLQQWQQQSTIYEDDSDDYDDDSDYRNLGGSY